ncbi:energy transducer TonB [Myxococcota bacterium]|nr:energy transducer TonB [Myxococcota bacterium]
MRVFSSFVLAIFVTFGLFYIMHLLIAMTGSALDEGAKGRIIDFVRLKKESEIQEKKRKKPEKKPPPEPPPPPDLTTSSAKPNADMDGMGFGFSSDVSVDGVGGGGLAISDGDAVPMVRVPPEYPMRAAQRGLEGWVQVEFTISVTGSVKDARVVDSTSSIFHRAALSAIRKWKYNPKMVDGKAVEQPGEQVTLDFVLEDG